MDRDIRFARDSAEKKTPFLATIWFYGPHSPTLQHDPGEQNNLISEQKELAKELRTKLISWLKSARHSYERGDYPGYQRQGRFIPTPGIER